MSILKLLSQDNFLVVNKHVAKMIGLNETVILTQLISMHEYYEKEKKLTEEGFFFCTHERLEEETTIKRTTQDKAITVLTKMELLEKKMIGLPAKRHFKINIQAIENLVVSKDAGIQQAEEIKAEQRKKERDRKKKAEKPQYEQLAGIQQARKPESNNQLRRIPATINKEDINKESINKKNKDQSIVHPAFLKSVVEKNQKMMDRWNDIISVYEIVKNEKGYSDTLFVTTMQSAVKQTISIPFEQYLLVSMNKNMNRAPEIGQGGAKKIDAIPNLITEQLERQKAIEKPRDERTLEEKRQNVARMLEELG